MNKERAGRGGRRSGPMTRVEIETTLRQHKGTLRRRFKVRDIGVFGSCVRGDQKRGSDIDILVEFGQPVGLFEFMELEEYLATLLDAEIDLVSRKALKPRIGKRILEEVVYI